jgi:hypothetical protein
MAIILPASLFLTFARRYITPLVTMIGRRQVSIGFVSKLPRIVVKLLLRFNHVAQMVLLNASSLTHHVHHLLSWLLLLARSARLSTRLSLPGQHPYRPKRVLRSWSSPKKTSLASNVVQSRPHEILGLFVTPLT